MATVTEEPPVQAPKHQRTHVGPEHHGLAMDYDAFTEGDFREGWLYELARGIVIVTKVPELPHGRTIGRLKEMFILYGIAHPGVINYQSGGACCRIRLPGLKSDRRPDQAIYLHPDPIGPKVWARWISQIVVEVVSPISEDRDYVEKREEYLRVGVLEYWILDPRLRRMLVLLREGDIWNERLIGEDGVHRTELLPGLEARVGELLGPPVIDEA